MNTERFLVYMARVLIVDVERTVQTRPCLEQETCWIRFERHCCSVKYSGPFAGGVRVRFGRLFAELLLTPVALVALTRLVRVSGPCSHHYQKTGLTNGAKRTNV